MNEQLLQAERLLNVGLLDRAEAIFRQLHEADPGSAPALVGLARVALERGDDLDAFRLAGNALAADSGDEAARRMVTRLAEVLEVRGIAVERPAALRAAPPQSGPPQPRLERPRASESPSGSPPGRSLVRRILGRR